jgi:hypothetical protein
MTLDQVLSEATKWADDYNSRPSLGSDEELQMLAAAYAKLFLGACAKWPVKELADAHDGIAKCYARLGDMNWSSRHMKLAAAYQALEN